MNKEIFKINYKETNLVGDILPKGARPNYFFMYGAGPTAERSRYNVMRQELFEKGFGSCAFDFIGHGETGGNLKKSTLEDRTNQALAIINQKTSEPVHIVGASMSGYTAIKLSELCEIESLIMLAPAVYDKAAYSTPFDSGFTEIIRKPDSWKQTDAWDVLKSFKGNLLIFIGDQDQVIPREVVETMYESASQAHRRELVFLPNVPHPLGKYLQENSEERQQVVDKIISFIQ